MTVKELIEFLQTQPQDLLVGYACCSEYCLMSKDQIEVLVHCAPRPDGWIQRKRGDMSQQEYLMFPGI